MSNNDHFDEKEIDTGAGVSFQASSNASVDQAVPTPPASVYENNYYQQQEANQTAVDMPQEDKTASDQGNYYGYQNVGLSLPAMLGGSSSAPVYVRLQEDPEEVKRRTKQAYISLGITIVILLLVFIAPSFVRPGMGRNSQHQLVEHCDVKFDDVQGCDEVKGQLQKIVKFLKDPSHFEKFGAKMPRGYLLAGPPGVGKTMLAKAVAGESGVAFLAVSGAEFEEVYVGLGAARVRRMFNDAREHKKAVIFIDEIDAIAGKRHERNESSAGRQTLNQLLVEMDGFKTGNGIVVLAATNTPDSLDPAILRPGRFDKVFRLSPPDIKGRESLLKELIKAIPESRREPGDLKDLNVMWLAKITVGYTGADLANLVNHAKLIASGEDTEIITKNHFFAAKDFVDLGPTRDVQMDQGDRERTAYHEAGHAIVALSYQHKGFKEFAVEYATIVPHGQALGLVTNVPQRDLNHMSLEMLQQRMDMALGGYMAELHFYKNYITKVSTGASSDLKNVNNTARVMVEAGFGKNSKFLQMTENPMYTSEATKKIFEDDMKYFMDKSEERVEKILKDYNDAWKALAKALLEKNSLNRSEIEEIFNKNPPKKP